MQIPAQNHSSRQVWNVGRIGGPKPPLEPKHIWAIRNRLQHKNRVRDLAMFNLAIDRKLRGCDLVLLRVGDIVLGGTVRLRTTIVQQKTGRPVPFELTDSTREALTAWLKKRDAYIGDWTIGQPAALHHRVDDRHHPSSRTPSPGQPMFSHS
jgi:integrase